jgi:hypothetical protein
MSSERVRVDGFGHQAPDSISVSLRCPQCRQQGTFDPLGLNDLQAAQTDGTNFVLGHRRCPNPKCRTHVFFVWKNREVAASYPPETLDFDPENIPDRVRSALEEAIACHSIGRHVAAAMMIRKTLEEVCKNKKAKGENLKERLEALRETVVLPQELLDGLDDLRLLGNDAAHVEARVYDAIGKEEVDVSLELTKEMLKGLYQMSALVERLKLLKRAHAEAGEAVEGSPSETPPGEV